MMSNKVLKVISLLGAMFMASAASAGVINDVVVQNQYVGEWSVLNPYSYVHDLNDPVVVFTPGSALSGTLSIDIYDNEGDFFNHGELATIIVEILDGDTGGQWGGNWFGSPAPGWSNGLEVQALAALNATGQLQVLVSGIGGFYVGNSTLTVNTADPVAAPEPGMLSLIALGLMGLAGTSRRRRIS